MNTELEALRSRNPGVEILPRGTGNALPDGPKGILKKRNKWFVAHPENTAKVAAGDYPGLLGAMRERKRTFAKITGSGRCSIGRQRLAGSE